MSAALRVLPYAVLVLAAGLRAYGLGRWSLDGDEVYSWFDVQDILTGEAWRPGVRTAPLGFLAMAGAVKLAGLSEGVLRSVSALSGTAAVACLLCMRRDVIPRGTALAAGTLAAASPWLLYHSQSARFYGPLFLCSTLATLWLLPGSGRRPLASVVAWAAAVLCHPSALMLGVGIGLPLLLTADGRRRAVGVVVAVALLLGLVLYLDDGTVIGVFQRVFEGEDPGRYEALHLVMGLGYNLGPVVGLLAAAGLWVVLGRDRTVGLVLAGCAIVPPAFLVIVAFGGLSLHQRYAMCAVPGALLLAGWGLAGAWRRGRAFGAVLTLSGLAAFAPALAAHVQDGNRHDLRAVAAWLAENAGGPDALYVVDEHATVDLYLHAHAGFADITTHEAPLDARKRLSFPRHRKDCWVALKASRLDGAYGPEFDAWVDNYFEEVARIGRPPMPLVRHDNRYVIFHRKERVR